MRKIFRCTAFAALAASTALATAMAASPAPLAPPKLVPPQNFDASAQRLMPLGAARDASQLQCRQLPCALRNRQVSTNGAYPVVETPIAADLGHPKYVIAAAVDYSCSPEVVTYQGFYVSSDGGRSWIQECGTVAPGAAAGLGDPIIGYDLNGSVYRGGINIIDGTGQWVIALAKSTDHGMTWNPPVITTQIANITSDKPWFASDNNPKSPYVDSLYVSSTGFDSNSNTTVDFSRSTDGGKTWTTVAASPQALNPAVVEGSDIAVGADGTIYLAYLYCAPAKNSTSCAGGRIKEYIQKSTDGGTIWSAPVVALKVDAVPDNCNPQYWGCIPKTGARVVDYPSIAIDKSNGPYSGRLYAVCWNWTGQFMQTVLSASNDGGKTWSVPVPVATNGVDHDQFMPWLDVSPGGLVGITWLDRRNDPKNISYEAFAAVSSDGGTTFPNFQLASRPSNPKNDGFPGGLQGAFLGDYRGNAWAGANKLLAAWPDTRNKVESVAEVGGLKGFNAPVIGALSIPDLQPARSREADLQR